MRGQEGRKRERHAMDGVWRPAGWQIAQADEGGTGQSGLRSTQPNLQVARGVGLWLVTYPPKPKPSVGPRGGVTGAGARSG